MLHKTGVSCYTQGKKTETPAHGKTMGSPAKDVAEILNKEVVTTVDDLYDRLNLVLGEEIYLVREMGKKKLIFTYFTIPYLILLEKR
jgi:hypothetical protein